MSERKEYISAKDAIIRDISLLEKRVADAEKEKEKDSRAMETAQRQSNRSYERYNKARNEMFKLQEALMILERKDDE